MNMERCAYCPHFSEGETLVKKKLVLGTWVFNWTPGPESGLLPAGLALFSLPVLWVMTHVCSCLHGTNLGN